MKSNFIEIEGALINPDVAEIKFSCDLGKCKGACCTMESEYGAPLKAPEIEKIEENLSVILEYLPKEHVKEIKQNGFWEMKFSQLMTKSINNKECVFVYYEGDIAKCGIEKAYFDEKIDFRKPISCHLFPIRISNHGGEVLRFEHYSECKPALEKGIKQNISTAEFCKDALIRFFDKDWFEKLKSHLRNY